MGMCSLAAVRYLLCIPGSTPHFALNEVSCKKTTKYVYTCLYFFWDRLFEIKKARHLSLAFRDVMAPPGLFMTPTFIPRRNIKGWLNGL